jgi:hypothetical protein
MHNAYMSKDAAVTVRLPAALKRRLEARAKSQHRSLSAQLVADLEAVAERRPGVATPGGHFLGLFRGTALPTDRDIAEARRLLWGNLG